MILLEQLADGTVADRNFQKLGRAVNPPLPQARVYNSADLTISTATTTALTFDSERFDNGSVHSTGANTSRLTAPITGLYLVVGHVVWAANATGVRIADLRVNGSTKIGGDERTNTGAGDTVIQTVPALWHFAAGDYVELVVLQNSGGNLKALADAGRGPELSMVRLGGYTNQGV